MIELAAGDYQHFYVRTCHTSDGKIDLGINEAYDGRCRLVYWIKAYQIESFVEIGSLSCSYLVTIISGFRGVITQTTNADDKRRRQRTHVMSWTIDG